MKFFWENGTNAQAEALVAVSYEVCRPITSPHHGASQPPIAATSRADQIQSPSTG